MMQLPHLITRRPAYFDVTKVSAIIDQVEMVEPAIHGGRPSLQVVGTIIIVDGQTIPIAGEPSEVAEVIIAERRKHFPTFSLEV